MPETQQESLVSGAKDAPANSSIPHTRMFGPVERRLFRYTAVLASVVALTALIGIIIWGLAWVLHAFYHLLLSLSLAGILALVLHPVVEFLERRLHLPRLWAVLLLLVIFTAVLGALIYLAVPALISQSLQLLTILPETLADWRRWFSWQFPDLSSMIASRMNGNGVEEAESIMPALETTRRTIMSYLGVLAAVSFVPLFLFFLLLSGESLRDQVTEILSIFRKRTQQKVLYFGDVFVEYVSAFFQGQLMIAGSMGVLYALSFTLIGLQYGVLVGFALGLLNIVPFLGTLIGLLIVLPLSFFQPDGGADLLFLAIVVFIVVQVIESWLLTPKIMANRSGLHPALVVISLFFWGTILGGIIGMILAVPLTAFFVAIWGEIKTSLKHTLSNREAPP